MALTKAEIIAAREEIDQKIAEANAAVRRARLELQILYTYCEHPDKFQYSAMGELGWKCPDCGWAT